MKYSWRESRRKELLKIPESYLVKNSEQQNRRELTFLLQEAAFSENVPLFHIFDLECSKEKAEFVDELPNAKSVLYFGIPIHDPFLLKEQRVPGLKEDIVTTIAQLKVENYLWNFSEKIEIQGYQVKRVLPITKPDHSFADRISMAGVGYTGKNGRFLCETYGSRVCMGFIVTDAPLMGGDYRDPSIGRFENPCKDCAVCIEICPTKAISHDKVDKKKCMENCFQCMEQCPAGDKIMWEKYGW